MTKSKSFKWYRITGHTVGEMESVNLTFVYFVEAQKPQHVIKYYGGKRKVVDEKQGIRIFVQFPNRPQEVMPMPASWEPLHAQDEQNEPNVVTKIVPAIRYQCDCGEVRLSEFPYPSMWCSCGHKAFPLQDTILG